MISHTLSTTLLRVTVCMHVGTLLLTTCTTRHTLAQYDPGARAGRGLAAAHVELMPNDVL